jgi:peptidoglycan/LPS O-acetylase OafA/YrhL
MRGNDRVPVIDLLRGLSCLGILLFHIRVDLWVGWWRIKHYPNEYSAFSKAIAWLSIPTPFLGYSILLFFLISGFCIHYPNTLNNSRPIWKTYFLRRLWRVCPPYLVALLVTMAISYYCHIQWGDTTWDPDRIIRVATFSQNYPPGVGQFLSNPSLWTIPLEIEFYLLYPLAFCLFSQLRSWTLAVLAFGLCGWSVFLNAQGTSWTSFTSLFFWPTWLLGAWVAQLHRDRKLSAIPLQLLLPAGGITLSLALASRLYNWDSWIQYFLWIDFYLFLFIFSLAHQEMLSRIFFSKALAVLAWLGKISFSLYLLHFPLFKLFGYLHRSCFGEKPANFLVSLAYLIPVCFLAWLFFLLVERPIHQWSKKRLAKE